MIRIERFTSDPNYVDDEVLIFNDFIDMRTEIYCISDVEEVEMLEEMTAELISLMGESFDDLVVKRHIGDGTVVVMSWIVE